MYIFNYNEYSYILALFMMLMLRRSGPIDLETCSVVVRSGIVARTGKVATTGN